MNSEEQPRASNAQLPTQPGKNRRSWFRRHKLATALLGVLVPLMALIGLGGILTALGVTPTASSAHVTAASSGPTSHPSASRAPTPRTTPISSVPIPTHSSTATQPDSSTAPAARPSPTPAPRPASPPAPALPPGAPRYAALIGQPKSVTDSTGATAQVTLNGVRFVPRPWGSVPDAAYVLVDLTITGTSAKPFTYNESYVVSGYNDSNGWTVPENSWGGDPQFDYTPYLPPNPLRLGQVSAGQTVRGLVAISSSLDTNYLIAVVDTHTADPFAVWRGTSPKHFS